jgi:antibiotic biosynthesis monooxygenase (ABM) superfamily enzyme
VGVAWYQREQWAHLRELAADAESLEEHYDEWVASAERALATVKAQGLTVERVTVDIDGMAEWCRRAGRPFDGKARSEYVAELMRKRDSQA